MIKGNIFFKHNSNLYDFQSVINCLYSTISEENPIVVTLESKNGVGFNLLVSCNEMKFTKWFNYGKSCDKFNYEGDLIMDILFRIKDDLKENGIPTHYYRLNDAYMFATLHHKKGCILCRVHGRK